MRFESVVSVVVSGSDQVVLVEVATGAVLVVAFVVVAVVDTVDMVAIVAMGGWDSAVGDF